jgi:hypothetical protein
MPRRIVGHEALGLTQTAVRPHSRFTAPQKRQNRSGAFSEGNGTAGDSSPTGGFERLLPVYADT